MKAHEAKVVGRRSRQRLDRVARWVASSARGGRLKLAAYLAKLNWLPRLG